MWTLIFIGMLIYIAIKLWWVFLIIFGIFVLFAVLVVVSEQKNGKSGTNTFTPTPQPKRNTFTTASSGWFEEKPQKKHNGRCNGDCANCPPHYGYRYGRWYYGRNHIRGCQFGGNRGGGGFD